jgi:fructokinase
VTAGADGVIAVSSGVVLRLPAEPVTVVDTVGAGDTFTAGMLHALADVGRLGGRLTGLDETEVLTALRYAGRAAAVTCGRVGADPPTAADVPD